jgi:hypothetical protein
MRISRLINVIRGLEQIVVRTKTLKLNIHAVYMAVLLLNRLQKPYRILHLLWFNMGINV